jgi:LysM repeat protein
MENENKTENTPSQDPLIFSFNKQRFPLSSLEMVFGSLIILGLIYLGYVIFFQDSDGSGARVEKRVKQLELAFREQSEGLEKRIKTIQDNQSRLEERLKALENSNQGKTAPQVKTQPPKVEEKKPIKAQPSNVEEKKPQTPPPVRKEIRHKVKRGETLQSIASKYKVSTKDLMGWNKSIKKKPIRPGDTLIIVSR